MSDASTAPAPLPAIEVKAATVSDLRAALAAGFADFRRAPQFGLFFGAIYTAGGRLIVLSVFALGIGYLAYPLAAGFALIGPFVAVGHVVGAGLACVLFSLTVVSFPLLLDQDRDFITAMITSVRAVVESPVVMLGWGLVIALLLLLAMLPAFLGLPFVLPVLGHATWHLYRRLVSYRPVG